MNIFYLDPDPKTCAEYHNSKHVVKMILESAQLLSTAHRILDGTLTNGKSKSGRNKKVWQLPNHLDSVLYSATHINHPSAIWVRQSRENYLWLANLLQELSIEYTYRYGKIHKCENDGLIATLLNNLPANIPTAPFTEPTPAMPNEVRIPGSSLLSYRNYYSTNKRHLANWTGRVNGREIPDWFDNKYPTHFEAKHE